MRITASLNDVYRFYPSYGEWALFTLLIGRYVVPFSDHFIHATSESLPSLIIKDREYFGRIAESTQEGLRGDSLQTLGLWQDVNNGAINLIETEPPAAPTPASNHLGLAMAGMPQIRSRLFRDSGQILTFIDVQYDIERNQSRGVLIYGNE